VSAIAGLLASSVGKGIMHPIDTIKAKLQVISLPGVNSQSIKGEGANGKSLIMNIARETVRSEGIRGLYKGFGIHVGGGIPAGGIYYGSYEFFKKTTLQMPYL
jgi:Mitochondrial carrier protein